jgi:hypothetical protein
MKRKNWQMFFPSKVMHTIEVGHYRINVRREQHHVEDEVPLFEICVWDGFKILGTENYTQLEWAINRAEELEKVFAVRLAMEVLGIGGVEPS